MWLNPFSLHAKPSIALPGQVVCTHYRRSWSFHLYYLMRSAGLSMSYLSHTLSSMLSDFFFYFYILLNITLSECFKSFMFLLSLWALVTLFSSFRKKPRVVLFCLVLISGCLIWDRFEVFFCLRVWGFFISIKNSPRKGEVRKAKI